MSTLTVTTQINRKYLMSKTKDELCSMISWLMGEIEALKAEQEQPECQCMRYKQPGDWHKEWCPLHKMADTQPAATCR
jgi:hypothetical protein